MAINKKKKWKNFKKRQKPEFEQKLLDLARVTRVVKGGRRFSFRATVVVGNKKGKVGVGVGKGTDVSIAIQKGVADAKKHLISVKLDNGTISHEIYKKSGSAKLLLKPAAEGHGVIAGGAVRVVMDLLGVKDVVAKSLGTTNKLNVARCAVVALSELSIPKNASKTETEISEKDTEKTVSKSNSKSKKGATVDKKAKEVKNKKTSTKNSKDDLTKIEGIGPKIAKVLSDNGIKTFDDLASSKVEDISKILNENKLSNHSPDTWAKQATLAKDGKWDELKKLQDDLDGGKVVK